MIIAPPPGLAIDLAASGPDARWLTGFNVRFRMGQAETIGLFGPLRGVSGAQVQLPGANAYRSIFNTPSPTTGQILAGSTSALRLLQFDPGSSTPGAPPRWAQFDVAPPSLPTISDVLTDPPAGRIEIPPVWWFADQDDLVVGQRANGPAEPCYAWDRNSAHTFAALAGSPLGAVGGGIVNRILVLLGCTSITDPDPARFLTIRWCDRFNFEDWTPSDINVSGELQLEGGSRIVGGGGCAYGVVAWTDKRMAVLSETGDSDSVFARTYVDGSRGLLANRAWCEADATIWWLDETRNLNGFDGGRPRTIVNPLKGFLERMTDKEAARVYLVANPEFTEVLIWFPLGADATEPDACIVYNYSGDGCWSFWRLPRPAWCSRFGTVPNLAVGPTGLVYRHDLDCSMPDDYLNPSDLLDLGEAPETSTPPVADVSAFDFGIITNLITTGEVSRQTWQGQRLMVDHIPSPAVGAEEDQLDVSLVSYNEPALRADVFIDSQVFAQGQVSADFRVEGKGLQVRIQGVAQKTHWRLGNMDLVAGGGGER